MSYHLEGRLLEVCNCRVLCPCWIGEDPDFKTCDTIVAWHFDQGTIDGVDVTGRTLAMLAHVPGNILQGNWTAAVYLDDGATPAQEAALLGVYTGQKGGPVADLAKLVGEVVEVERVPFTFDVEKGKGRLRIGNMITADLEPFRGAGDVPTALTDSIFSTIPGSPAYVGKAGVYKAKAPSLGINVDLNGHNAVQGSFRFNG